MKQFDVCRNRAAPHSDTPFFVVIQSAEFDRFRRRLVIPLKKAAGLPRSFAPVFEIEGLQLTADALQLFSIPVSQLGAVVASLADDTPASSLMNAIDRVISRAYA